MSDERDVNGSPDPAALPRNVIVVLLDSLNRSLIGPYGGEEFDTPELDRFARRAVRWRSTSCGGPGGRSRCGRTPSPTSSAGPA